MKKKSQAKKTADIKNFFKDLLLLDRKLFFTFLLMLFLSLFLTQKVTVDENGSVFGVKTELLKIPTINSQLFPIAQPALYPKKVTDVPTPLVSAQSAIVIDVASQVVLYQKNQDTRFPPASTTKIMTALVGLDQFTLTEILEVPPINTPPANMGLVASEKISFENLLYGLLVSSGNDAAETIAKNSKGGYANFMSAMNRKVQELNLTNTHFENVTGLESENHYTTAIDLARLASFALKNKEFAKIVATRAKTVSDVSGRYVHTLENINKLLGVVEGADGIKTGYTQEAGQVLVAAATRNTHTIVTVVLKSEDRFLDSKNLLEWAFANHSFTPATHF